MSSSSSLSSAVARTDLPSDDKDNSPSSTPPKDISPKVSAHKPQASKSEDVLSTHNLQNRPLSDIIGETFPAFDHQTNIVTPFNNEMGRDTMFERELSSMLLTAILETHAWASTRPKHESSSAAQNIEQKIVTVMETEKEQDKTRQQLNHFVTQIKSALAALTGLTGI